MIDDKVVSLAARRAKLAEEDPEGGAPAAPTPDPFAAQIAANAAKRRRQAADRAAANAQVAREYCLPAPPPK